MISYCFIPILLFLFCLGGWGLVGCNGVFGTGEWMEHSFMIDGSSEHSIRFSLCLVFFSVCLSRGFGLQGCYWRERERISLLCCVVVARLLFVLFALDWLAGRWG